MNYLRNLIALCILLSFVACSSSDDSNDGDTPSEVTGNFFPSTTGNQWTYAVVNTDENDPAGNFTATDILKIATSNGNDFTLEVNDGTAPANGTFNALLVNGNLSRTDQTLTFNGTLELPTEIAAVFDANITLSNVVLYDVSASPNDQLSLNSDTISQDIDLGTTTVPLTVDFEFTTTHLGMSDSETVNGNSYSEVVKTRLILNISAWTSVDFLGTGVPLTYSILDPQNVLSIDVMYAKDVGLIKADASSSYSLSSEILTILNLAGINLGVPDSNSGTNRQELEDYILN